MLSCAIKDELIFWIEVGEWPSWHYRGGDRDRDVTIPLMIARSLSLFFVAPVFHIGDDLNESRVDDGATLASADRLRSGQHSSVVVCPCQCQSKFHPIDSCGAASTTASFPNIRTPSPSSRRLLSQLLSTSSSKESHSA